MARRKTSRRTLSFFSACPPFLGGKRRLAGVIFRELDRVIPRQRWSSLTFLDAFMGGASIALFAKAQGFERVIGTDLALRSVTIGEALVANSRVKLANEDVLACKYAKLLTNDVATLDDVCGCRAGLDDVCVRIREEGVA